MLDSHSHCNIWLDNALFSIFFSKFFIALWEVNFLSHSKSVSVWQQEFSKIVKRRTFDLVVYIEVRKNTQNSKN